MIPDEIGNKLESLAIEQAKLTTRMDVVCGQVAETKTLVESVNKLAISIERLTNAQQNTSTQVERLRSDVDEIQKNPGKKWENLKSIVIAAIVTGAIGYALGFFFK
jgi:hypothetical protein